MDQRKPRLDPRLARIREELVAYAWDKYKQRPMYMTELANIFGIKVQNIYEILKRSAK